MNQNPLTKNKNRFDLEERLLKFSKNVRQFLKSIPRTKSNNEDGLQLTRSSGSIGANYIEANEHLGMKDLLMRIKISKKEAKESQYWLRIIDVGDDENITIARNELLKEIDEIIRILGTIYIKLNK